MSINIQNIAQIILNPIEGKKQASNTTKKIDLSMPSDRFDGKVYDDKKIDEIMSKFDLLIAQAQEKFSLAIQSYNLQRAGNNSSFGTREAQEKIKSTEFDMQELINRRKKCTQNPLLIENYFNEAAKNPNTSFLLDPTLLSKEKAEMLTKHPEIVALNDLRLTYPQAKSIIGSKKYFVKTLAENGTTYIDTANSINAQNLERLRTTKPISFEEISKKTGMNREEVIRYAENSLFERIKLLDPQNGEEIETMLIDWESKTTKKGLERLRKIRQFYPQKSKDFVQQIGGRTYTPTAFLSKIGYGKEEDILNELKQWKLTTLEQKVRTKNGDIRTFVFVNISDKKTAEILEQLRSENKNIYTIAEIAKKLKVSLTEVEEALLSGELTPIKSSAFDDKEIIFDISTEENKAYIDKKSFEAEFLKKNRRKETSLRNRLIWHLCPKTKEAATKAFAQYHKTIEPLKNELDYTKKKLGKTDSKSDEARILEDKLNELQCKIDKLRWQAYSQMWEEAGSNEYDFAADKAEDIMTLVRLKGLDVIKDEEIRNIFLEQN